MDTPIVTVPVPPIVIWFSLPAYRADWMHVDVRWGVDRARLVWDWLEKAGFEMNSPRP